jgi:tripartite-type tricarboxylate transporter receptor subunit TctC
MLAVCMRRGANLAGETGAAHCAIRRGSVLDTMMRAMQNELSAALGQPVVIESRPGAGGTVGTAAVAKSPADGYTLLIAANSHNINGSVYSNLPYHPLKDFTALASVGVNGLYHDGERGSTC